MTIILKQIFKHILERVERLSMNVDVQILSNFIVGFIVGLIFQLASRFFEFLCVRDFCTNVVINLPHSTMIKLMHEV